MKWNGRGDWMVDGRQGYAGGGGTVGGEGSAAARASGAMAMPFFRPAPDPTRPGVLGRVGRNGRPKLVRSSHAASDRPFIGTVKTHSRTYDLRKVRDVCGPAFAKVVAAAWTRAFANDAQEHTGKIYLAFLSWIRFLGAAPPASPSGKVLAQLRTQERQVNLTDFEDATREFTAALHDLQDRSVVGTEGNRTRSGKIHSLAAFIDRMAPLKILPRGHALTGLKRSSSPTTKTPALAELDRGGRIDMGPGTVPVSHPVLGDPDDQSRGLSSPDALVGYAALNKKRRYAVRDWHERSLRQALAWKREGDAILGRADLPTVAEVAATLVALPGRKSLNPMAMLAALEAARPAMALVGSPVERMRTIMVKYVSEAYGGAFQATSLPHGLQRAMALAGGANEIVRRLEGDFRAMQAAHTIVLVDTGLGTSCVDLLPDEPFVGAARRGSVIIRTVEAPKMRAGGKIVEGLLLDRMKENGEEDPAHVFGVEAELSIKGLDGRLAGAEAIRIWQELSTPMRIRAREQDDGQADLLWIVPHSQNNDSWIGLYGVAAGFFNWEKFLAEVVDDPEIGHLRITRRMLRTTWQQVKFIEGGLDHVDGQLMGQHSSSAITSLYVDATAIRSVHHHKYREYLVLYEVAAASTIAGMAARLGMSPETYRQKLELAVHTGLGIHCLDTHAGMRPGVEKGEPCPADACADCALGVFKAGDEEALEALHLARLALDGARDAYIDRNPERWLRLWLPVDASSQAWAETLSKGVHRLRFARAGLRAHTKLEKGSVCLPLIW